MAYIKVRVPRTNQPQDTVGIDWSIPLSNGLTLLTTGNHEIDYATRGIGSVVGTTLSQAITPQGVGRSNASLGASHVGFTRSVFGNGDITAIMLGAPSSAANINSAISQAGAVGSIWFGANADEYTSAVAGQLCLGLLQTGVNRSSIKAASGVSGNLELYAVRKQASNHQWWRSGTKLTTTTTGTLTGAPAAASDSIKLLGDSSNGALAFDKALLLTAVWNRALSDAEVKSLSDNPWQIFEPEERLIWIPDAVSAGGITYTLTCSAGSYLVSGKAASFSVARRMTAGSGAYSVSGNAATLYYFARASPNAYALTASSGIYALSGNDSSFTHARAMSASNGAYALSGEPSGLAHARSLSAAPGAYSLSGKSAVLAYTSIGPINYTLAAMPGVYVAMGGDVNFAFSGAIKGGGMPPRKKFYVETPSGVVAVDSLIEASRIINKINKTAVVPVVTLGGIKIEAPVRKQLDYAAIEARMRAEIQAEIDDEEDLLMLFA